MGKNSKSNFSDDTISFWSKRYGKLLTHEAAREITTNITGFFNLLAAWQMQKQKESTLPVVSEIPSNPEQV